MVRAHFCAARGQDGSAHRMFGLADFSHDLLASPEGLGAKADEVMACWLRARGSSVRAHLLLDEVGGLDLEKRLRLPPQRNEWLLTKRE